MTGCRLVYQLEEEASVSLEAAVRDTVRILGWKIDYQEMSQLQKSIADEKEVFMKPEEVTKKLGKDGYLASQSKTA